ADPGQRGASHRSCTQKSHRGGSSPVSRRSVENQNRPAPSTRAGLNQLKTSSRGTERRTLFEQINHFGTWALPGAQPAPKDLRVRRLRLGAPSSSSST